MGKSYSTDLRERVLRAIDEGMSKTRVARTFPISRSTIDHWFALRQRTGRLDPPPQRRSYARPLVPDRWCQTVGAGQLEGAAFEEFVRRPAHATLGEMARA